MRVSKKQLIEAAKLQPLEYFEKYHDILVNNLWVSIQRANKERKRGPEWEMTAQVIEQTETRGLVFDTWFLENVINIKKELLANDRLF